MKEVSYAREESSLPKIVLVAQPFAYGPISKLVAIAKQLQGVGRLTFVGADTAFDFASRNAYLFQELVDSESTEARPDVLDGADLVISVMEEASVLSAARKQIPVMYVDSLHWLWWGEAEVTLQEMRQKARDILVSDSPLGGDAPLNKPERARLAYQWSDIVCLQGLDESAERIRSSTDADVRVVGAVIDTPAADLDEVRVDAIPLVSVGGTLSPINPPEMADRYIRLVNEVLSGSRESLQQSLFTGHPFAVDRFKAFGWNAHSLDRQSMAKEMSRASFLLSQGGLTTALEATALGTPMCFLPETIRSHKPNRELVSGGDHSAWPAVFLPFPDDEMELTPHEQFVEFHKKVLDPSNPGLLRGMQRELAEHIERLSDPATAREIAKAQRSTVLGRIVNSFSGAEEVAEAARSLLKIPRLD